MNITNSGKPNWLVSLEYSCGNENNEDYSTEEEVLKQASNSNVQRPDMPNWLLTLLDSVGGILD